MVDACIPTTRVIIVTFGRKFRIYASEVGTHNCANHSQRNVVALMSLPAASKARSNTLMLNDTSSNWHLHFDDLRIRMAHATWGRSMPNIHLDRGCSYRAPTLGNPECLQIRQAVLVMIQPLSIRTDWPVCSASKACEGRVDV